MRTFPLRFAAAAAIIAAGCLTACSNTTAASPTTGKASSGTTQKLDISVWGVNEDIDSIKAAAAGFQKANPAATLNFRVGDCGADYAACKTMIAGKNMSDVVVTGSWNYNQMVNDGVLLDITDRLTADGISTDKFTPVAVESDKAAKDGRYHGLPMGYNIQSMFYNTAMFKKAGLKPPPADGSYTYDQVREWARKLTLDSFGRNADDPAFDPNKITQWGYYNRVAIPSDTGYSPVMATYGGGVLTGPQRNQCKLEDPGSAQALQLLQDMMWKDHSAITPQLEAATPGYLRWIQGHVAMQQGSHEQVTIAAKQNPKLAYDMAALPKGPAGNATLVQVHSWAVYSGAKNTDLATKFVEYMATQGSGKQMGLIPAWDNRSQGPDFAKAAGEPAHLVQAQLEPAAWPLTFTNIDPQGVSAEVSGQDGIGPAMTAIITDKKPAAAALAGSCSRIRKILGS